MALLLPLLPWILSTLLALAAPSTAAAASALTLPGPLHSSSRWLLSPSNKRVKLRCVNWASHMEPNTPEGLQHGSAESIIAKITALPFNCVRLTYSIELALAPQVKTRDSFVEAARRSGAGEAQLLALYERAKARNPALVSDASTRIGVLAGLVKKLADAGVMVVLDNHVSRAGWCCNLTDGNGWWADAPGYVAANSRYFDTDEWLRGLAAMGSWARDYPNVVGMGIRNEIRGIPLLQDPPDHGVWYERVTRGIDAVLGANDRVFAAVGGTLGGTDFGFQRWKPLDRSRWAGRVAWEYHVYSYSVGYNTGDCGFFKQQMGAAAGYLLQQGKAYTGPLWVSEFGFGMAGGPNEGGLNDQDYKYFSCLRDYLEGNDADWSYWALMGDYYVRDGIVSYDESYGLLNRDWSGYRHPDPKTLFRGLWDQKQGP